MPKRTFVVILALGLVALGAALYGTFRTPKAEPVEAEPRAASPTALSAPVAAGVAAPPLESPEMARLSERRRLYESVDALLRASELEQARKLLDEDQARYGDELAPPWHDLAQSYRLIADCLEKPSPQLRSRAKAFTLVSEAHSLKPRVLEACAGER